MQKSALVKVTGRVIGEMEVMVADRQMKVELVLVQRSVEVRDCAERGSEAVIDISGEEADAAAANFERASAVAREVMVNDIEYDYFVRGRGSGRAGFGLGRGRSG